LVVEFSYYFFQIPQPILHTLRLQVKLLEIILISSSTATKLCSVPQSHSTVTLRIYGKHGWNIR
jgi:hypothetical protein